MASYESKYDGPLYPEKVVIIAGPSFGTAIRFVLLGAAIGAAGAFFWHSQQAASATGADELSEDVAGNANRLVDRLSSLKQRMKSVAGRAKDAVHTASEVLGPAIQEAVAEGKNAAQDIEQQLHEELDKEPAASTRPSIAPDPA